MKDTLFWLHKVTLARSIILDDCMYQRVNLVKFDEPLYVSLALAS